MAKINPKITISDQKISVRVRKIEENSINFIISSKPDKYNSVSHFIRCAIIKLIREELNNTHLRNIPKLPEKKTARSDRGPARRSLSYIKEFQPNEFYNIVKRGEWLKNGNKDI